MVHQYKNNGYDIVLDVNSGAIHVVDDVTYDVIEMYAAARLEGMSYSKLMGALHKAGIEINRKVLADLAMNHPEAFKAIVAKAKAA